jgi:hypothetical protein
MKTINVSLLLALILASGAPQMVLADPPQASGPSGPLAPKSQPLPSVGLYPPVANPFMPIPGVSPFFGPYLTPTAAATPLLVPVAAQTDTPTPAANTTPKPIPAIPGGNGFYPNVIEDKIDDARLKYKVTVPRPFGWTIMDVIPIEIEMVTDTKVTLDLSTIMKQGVIGFKGSDYRFALLDPHLSIRQQDGDKVLYLLKLNVQTSVPKNMVPFVIDFRYARDTAPGKDPIWKDAELKPFNLTYANPTDDGTDAMQGPLDFVSGDSPYQMWTVLALSTILIGLLPGLLLLRFFHRVLPSRVKTRAEIAWQALKPAFRAGMRYGFNSHTYEQIAEAVRFYFDCAALTYSEISAAKSGYPQLPLLLEVLKAYESAIDGADISPENQKSLMRQVAKLVPRPQGIL